MDTKKSEEKKAKHYLEWKLDDQIVKDMAERHRERQYSIMKDYKFEVQKRPV